MVYIKIILSFVLTLILYVITYYLSDQLALKTHDYDGIGGLIFYVVSVVAVPLINFLIFKDAKTVLISSLLITGLVGIFAVAANYTPLKSYVVGTLKVVENAILFLPVPFGIYSLSTLIQYAIFTRFLHR